MRKPNKDIFKKICEDFKMKYENVISIGDQVFSDILPAKSLGMRTILVGSESEEANYSINSIENVLDVVKRIKNEDINRY